MALENDGKRKKRNFNIGIREKLLIAFLVPVAFLIFLGVISYRQTAGALRSLYQSTSMQILGKSADYLKVLMLNVDTTAYDLSTDADFVNYFSKTPTEGVDYSYLASKLDSYLRTDAYIENGYFIATEGNEHLSTNPKIVFDADTYSVFCASEDYIQVTSK